MKIAAFYENILEGARAKGITPREAVEALMKDGLELLYLAGFTYYQDPERFRALLKETGIGVEGIYMFCDYINRPDDPCYEELIDITAELGGTNVLYLPGILPPGSEDFENKKKLMAEGLARSVEYGKKKGIAVSLEDFDGMEAPYNSIEGLDYFMKAVPDLACSFDTGNFIMFSEDELEAFERFRDRLCTMHLKDRARSPRNPGDEPKTCADGSVVYPEITGWGYIRMEEILRRLKDMNYPGNVIVELYSIDKDHMLDGIAESVKWVAAHR